MLWNDIIGLTKAKFVSEHAQLLTVWPTLQNALLFSWCIYLSVGSYHITCFSSFCMQVIQQYRQILLYNAADQLLCPYKSTIHFHVH